MALSKGKNRTGYKLIIDAHMHIRSLNATPMPLQWGVLYKQASAQQPIAAAGTKFAGLGRKSRQAGKSCGRSVPEKRNGGTDRPQRVGRGILTQRARRARRNAEIWGRVIF